MLTSAAADRAVMKGSVGAARVEMVVSPLQG